METTDKRIVILGGGFGGLAVAKHLRGEGAQVCLVDRTNHHLFQPLLYQVATASLAAPNIAQPLRSIFSNQSRIEVLMAGVETIDLVNRTVRTDKSVLPYDYLVIALGSQTNYFGNESWRDHARGLKTLNDAHRIRNQVLEAFERAESCDQDDAERKRLMTCVVIGAGPTGVELAGTFAELFKRLFRCDYRKINPSEAQVVLIDAMERILPNYSEESSHSAHRQLEDLGVEIVTGKMVKDIHRYKVVLDDREYDAENIIWTAGVSANSLTQQLEVEKTKSGQIRVNPDLSLPGHPEVFAIGDIAYLEDEKGMVVPGVAQGAIQMGKHCARLISREIGKGYPGKRAPFTYRNKGNLATIGRSRAVAEIGKRKFSGFTAWIVWLVVHLAFLMGMRNRLVVLLQWFYSYIRNKPGARIIWRADKT